MLDTKSAIVNLGPGSGASFKPHFYLVSFCSFFLYVSSDYRRPPASGKEKTHWDWPNLQLTAKPLTFWLAEFKTWFFFLYLFSLIHILMGAIKIFCNTSHVLLQNYVRRYMCVCIHKCIDTKSKLTHFKAQFSLGIKSYKHSNHSAMQTTTMLWIHKSQKWNPEGKLTHWGTVRLHFASWKTVPSHSVHHTTA